MVLGLGETARWLVFGGLFAGAGIVILGPRRLLRVFSMRRSLLLLVCGLLASAGCFRVAGSGQESTPSALGDRLAEVQSPCGVELRGKVVRQPQLRSRSTVELVVAVAEFRMEGDNRWRRLAGERVMLRVYTRRSANQTGRISKDLGEFTLPTAYGLPIEAQARYSPGRRTWFDYGQHWTGGSVPCASLRAYWKKVMVPGHAPRTSLMHRLLCIKAGMLERFEARLPDPVYRLAAGAALGDRGPVRLGTYRGLKIRSLFAHAGIGHVLAVSGLHVGILCAGLIGVLKVCRVPPRWMILPLGVALGIFFVLTGARPATARAVLMALTGLVAYGFGRRTLRFSAWTGVSTAALVLLLYQPRLLWDAGFQLSFSAVLSLLLLTRPIEKRLGKLTNPAIGMWTGMIVLLLWAGSSHMEFISSPGGVLTLGCAVVGAMWVSRRLRRAGGRRRRNLYRRLPRFIRSLLAAQLAIQLGMIIPLSGSYFGHFSVAGVLVNLFAIPLIGIFVQAAVLAGVLGTVPVAGEWLAWIPEQVTTLSGLLFFEVAHQGASIFSYPEVPGFSATGLAAYYAALFALFQYRGVGQRAMILNHRFLDFARAARYAPIAIKTR
jgi:ComEC/Rec2-related protein